MKLQRNYSGNTLEAYILDINKLLKFLKDNGISPEEAKLSDIQCFAASLHDIGISPRSQCRILSGVRAFYKYLCLDGYIKY